MRKIATIFVLLLMLAGVQVLSGCAVYGVAVEERNVGDWANDNKITVQVEEKFLDDETVKFMDFDAHTYEGHVFIVGEYESRDQTTRAVEIAKSIEGVRQVTTYFLPKREHDYCGTTDNLSIYTDIKQKLVGDGDIWSTNVTIKTIQCNVVLLGIVGSDSERAKIISHAKSAAGVRSVKSHLKVR